MTLWKWLYQHPALDPVLPLATLVGVAAIAAWVTHRLRKP